MLKNLDEAQQYEVPTMIGRFYAGLIKDPPNVHGQFRTSIHISYLAMFGLTTCPNSVLHFFVTRGGPSVFVQPPHQPVADALENNVEHKLLDQHDGFALKPKKLIERFKENPNPSSDVVARLFVHMKNHVANNEHFTAVKNAPKGQHVDLQPTAGLDIAIYIS